VTGGGEALARTGAESKMAVGIEAALGKIQNMKYYQN
jgi:hypothetical protein